MPKKLLKRVTMVAGLYVALAALQPVSAEAYHRQAGSAGTAILGSDRACFGMSFGAMINQCSGGTRGWEMPLPIETSGGNVWNVYVAVGGTMTCRAYSASSSGAFVSGPAATTVTGAHTFTAFNVGVFDSLNLYCLVPQNGRVNQAIWWI